MRNKYSKEFINHLAYYAPKHSMTEIMSYTNLSKHQVEQLLWRNNIHHKDYNPHKAHTHNSLPLLSEYIKPDGMTLIKVSKNKWEYKQRYIYEQYHNIILPTNIMVIFLDGNKNNFDINNLRAVSTPTYNTARNKHLLTNDINISNAALDLAELYQEIKEDN